MQPDVSVLLEQTDITTPVIGFYDTPDPAPFEPFIMTKPGKHTCVFSSYRRWLRNEQLYMTPSNPGCKGAGYWLCNLESGSRDDFVKFLSDEEGLKASRKIVNQWLDNLRPYRPEYPHIILGPLKADQYDFLKSVTFFVNPDQLSALILGAHYNNAVEHPAPVVSRSGSGCMQLIPLFEDLNIPQAIIGGTDPVMRQYLPANILAFTVTKPMFKQLCELNRKSFLYKPPWKALQKTRAQTIKATMTATTPPRTRLGSRPT